MIYLELFWRFFTTGLFSVGGGMATIPFLRDMAETTHWFSSAQLADMIAVAESTPGPMGVNTATYVGYTVGQLHNGIAGGILGSVVATLGIIAPSIVVILIVAYFLERFRQNRYVDAVFYGLRPASVGLIGAAGFGILLLSFFGVNGIYDLLSGVQFDWRHWLLALVILVLTRWVPQTKKLHPIVFIAGSALVGALFGFAG